jgi:hypothetical protein
MQSITNELADTENTLFRHTARPDWGLAILAWRRDDKLGFQFQDGQLRIFKADLDLVQPVAKPADENERVVVELGKAIGRRRAAKRIGSDHALVSFADQLAYFTALFPNGFQGAKWAKMHRGLDARALLKRHRNPVINDAAADDHGERAANAAGVPLQRLPGGHFFQEEQAPAIAERVAKLAQQTA